MSARDLQQLRIRTQLHGDCAVHREVASFDRMMTSLRNHGGARTPRACRVETQLDARLLVLIFA
jgi:hypothetical protein